MNSERITWKGSVLTAPVPPALITCGPADKPNVFTVAWTGTLCTQPPKTYISVRPERYSYGLIKESGVFCINLPTKKLIRAIDYCGVKSGRDIDKIKEMKLETTDAKTVPTVLLCDSPVSLECKVCEIVKLGSHDMFIADITGVSVNPEYLDENGRLMLENAGLVAFAHGEYFELGKKLGSFGYSVRKKKKLHRK